jgi:hypothetical protein
VKSRVSFALLLAVSVLLASPARADTINPLVGVNFQPYIGAWSGNPLAPPLFNSYTYDDVLADLQTVQARGFASIKTYGVGTRGTGARHPSLKVPRAVPVLTGAASGRGRRSCRPGRNWP